MSYSDDQTEKVLHTLQKKIVKEFGQAYKDLSVIAKEYFEKLEIRDKKYKEGLLDGTIQPPPGMTADEHYKQWRMAQIGRGKRWEALRDDMARRVTNAQEHAAAYINDTTPGIYSLNANYEAYRIEQVDPSAAFNLVDEQTVKHLIGNEKQILPKRAIDVAKEQAWNNKKLQQSLLQGILMGKSIKKIAKDFDQVAQMGARAAVRAARTAVTGAQNAGRQETYERAAEMGIEIEKEWISVHDTRTRDSHRMLDGIRVPYNKKFPNGLMYPGDMSVNLPSEIWNCRCGMGVVLPGITDDARRVTWIDEDGNIQYGTRLKDAEEYEKWYADKLAKQKPRTHADATHRALNDSNTEQYYKKVVRGEDFIENKSGIIKAHKILTSNSGLYISDKVERLKPKQFSKIDKIVKSSMDLVGANKNNSPLIVIVADSEMKAGAIASYNPMYNVMKIRTGIFVDDTDGYLMPKDARASYIHELKHWKDAQKYQNKYGAIDSEEKYNEYIKWLNEKALKFIEKKPDFEYNRISKYAKRKIIDNDFNTYSEVMTEYYTMEVLINVLQNT